MERIKKNHLRLKPANVEDKKLKLLADPPRIAIAKYRLHYGQESKPAEYF